MPAPSPLSPTPPAARSQPAKPDAGLTSLELAQRSVVGIATLLAGLLAGFFVTYTISVTSGLAIAGDASYVEVMDAINATVSSPTFALMFFGAPAFACLAAVIHLGQPRRLATWACAIAAITLVSCVAITASINVPLNRELADAATAASVSVGEARAAYEAEWNRANALRVALSTVGFAALLMAATARGPRIRDIDQS